MNQFINIKKAFELECRKNNCVPNVDIFIKKIREVEPKKPIYVIIYEHLAVDGMNYEATITTANVINWPDKTNDPSFRSLYFHKSSSDSNCWVMKKNNRYSKEDIQKILVKNEADKFLAGL